MFLIIFKPIMSLFRFLSLIAICSILAGYPSYGLENSPNTSGVQSSGPGDKDDLSQIKRTNPIAPNRPAEQQALITAMGRDCHVLFIGDSNTHFWENRIFKDIWDHYYGDRHAINFGIGGDTINDIRSRLRDTRWGDCQPSVTVVLAGTNDRKDQPEYRAKKIKLLVGEVFAHFPHTHVLLISIPPCGLDKNEPLTTAYFATNDIIKSLADGKTTFFIDLAQTMTWEEGLGFAGIGGDRLHLNEEGRLRWVELMEPTIASILKDTPKTPLPHPELPVYTGDPHAPTILIAGDGAAAAGGFRAALQNELTKDGFAYHLLGPYFDPQLLPPLQSLYFGSWGERLDVLQKTIPPITQKYAPDILVLFAGFGEVNYGKNGTATIASRVGTLLDRVTTSAPSTRIVLCLITPNSDPAKNATIVTINKDLTNMLNARTSASRPIIVADCFGAVSPSMLHQGYNIDKEGFGKIATIVSSSIEAILRKNVQQRPTPVSQATRTVDSK
jgi:lysophospholipase L1-like esterase